MTTKTTTNVLVRFPHEAVEELRRQSAREGISMNELIVSAVHQRNKRRDLILQLLAEVKEEHADALAALADR